MSLLLAFTPLVLSVLSIAFFKRSALSAGLIGMVVTVAIMLAWPAFYVEQEVVEHSIYVGLYNTLNISLILFGGVFLYRVLSAGGALTLIADSILRSIDEPVHRLFGLVFGASVFFESATGFGVGIVVVAPLYIALGYKPMQAAVLALLGQCAVPWGALAVGTVIGAEISGVSELRLGALSAFFTLPLALLFGFSVLRIAGLVSLRSSLILCGYASGLSFLLFISSVVVGVELGGCVAGLLVIVAAVGITSGGKHFKNVKFPFAAFIPFIFLMAALFLTRLIPSIRHALQSIEVPVLPGASVAPLYHAGTYLGLSAILGLLLFPLARKNIIDLMRAVVRQWWLATLAVGSFVLFGQLMMDSGMTRQIAIGIAQAAGAYYPLAAPVIGAIGGFLTASNAASNALFMDLQNTAATELGLPVDVIAAAQNASGSNVTLASPGRLIFAASVVGQPGAESELLNRVAGVTVAGVVSASLVTAGLCWWY